MTQPLRKVLIANRGEIALRVQRACRERGLATVAVYSAEDADSLHVRFADEAVCIGKGGAGTSYLQIRNIIAAAEQTGADAIHPGYGFLSSSAEFAETCEACGLVFIGPRPEVLRTLLDRPRLARLLAEAGIPTTMSERSPREGAVFAPGVEVRDRSRRVEVQLVADLTGHTVDLVERDGSIRRREQPLIEECPSPRLSEAARASLQSYALGLARALGYTSLGSAVFSVDGDRVSFVTMIPRLDAGHPLTEMVTGIDLVAEQLRLAEGEPLGHLDRRHHPRGHAIMFRVHAEDPTTFAPQAGTLTALYVPGGPGVRVDSHAHEGYRASPHYDSLLAKVAVHGATRDLALARLRRVLSEMVIEGLGTNLALLRRISGHPAFLAGDYDTSFFSRDFDLQALGRKADV